jgi:hypothetical protein
MGWEGWGAGRWELGIGSRCDKMVGSVMGGLLEIYCDEFYAVMIRVQ